MDILDEVFEIMERQEKEEKEEKAENQEKEVTDSLPFNKNIVPEFYKIIDDFTEDIQTTFPEYRPIILKWWKRDVTEKEREDQSKIVFSHCLNIFPSKFAEILYQKTEMFDKDSIENTEFLPNIIFKHIWNADITEKTQKVIWKYLQLILFAIINTTKTSETSDMFQQLDETELKNKLEETMSTMKDLFKTDSELENDDSVKNVQEHFKDMTNGRIGKLALELAEETVNSMNMDNDVTSVQDMLTNFIKNPSKLIDMVQRMGSKLDEKIGMGEINESEIFSEGVEMLNKMKDFPGLSEFGKMFENLPNMNNMNNAQMGVFDTKMKQNAKIDQMKEKMRKKREKNQEKKEKKEDPELSKIDEIRKLFAKS